MHQSTLDSRICYTPPIYFTCSSLPRSFAFTFIVTSFFTAPLSSPQSGSYHVSLSNRSLRTSGSKRNLVARLISVLGPLTYLRSLCVDTVTLLSTSVPCLPLEITATGASALRKMSAMHCSDVAGARSCITVRRRARPATGNTTRRSARPSRLEGRCRASGGSRRESME